jgi:hypothetical protein
VLEWLHEKEPPSRMRRVCRGAAGGGHLDVLHWARAHGCPWDADTCQDAARGGHLAVLQWARAQTPPGQRQPAGGAAAISRENFFH